MTEKEWIECRYNQCLGYGQILGKTQVVFDSDLVSMDGICCTLFKEKWHTKQHILRAKREARYNFDVVKFKVYELGY